MGRGRRRVAKVIWLWVEERVWVRLRRLFLQEAIRVVLVSRSSSSSFFEGESRSLRGP